MRYSEGEGVEKDDKTALKWFRMAAERDYPPALYSLAVMYYDGCAVHKDMNKALELLRRAVALGDPEAEKFLKEIYDEEGIDGKDFPGGGRL